MGKEEKLTPVNLDEMIKGWESERNTFWWKIKRPYWVFIRFIKYLTPRHLKWLLQKIFRGYSNSDLWGLGYIIAKKTLPMLKAYRKLDRVGYPCSMLDDPMSNEIDDEKDKESVEKWNEILDKMIYAITYVVYDNGCNKKYEKYLGIEYEEGSDWKQTTESRDSTYKKYEEGIKLFAEYFNSLWD